MTDTWRKPSDAFDYLIVIPTVGEPDVLPPTVERVLRYMDGTRTLLVLSVNPIDKDRAERTVAMLQAVLTTIPAGSDIAITMADGPLGFAKAVNAGLAEGFRLAGGVPATTIILNDDVAVTSGWQQGLRSALDTTTIRLYGEPDGKDGNKPDHDAALYGRIGLVGPGSDNVAGTQMIPMDRETRQLAANRPDDYALTLRRLNAGNVMAADFLSGFCVAVDRACMLDLVEDAPAEINIPGTEHMSATWVQIDARPILFDERFGIGGYEDNDLCVRAELKGYRCVIAGDTFVHHKGHQTLDRHFPGALRGMANRITYYRKWAPFVARTQRVVGVMRIGWTFANDIHFTRGAIRRASELVDGLAVVFTNNPLDVQNAYDWTLAANSWLPEDLALFQACNNTDAEGVRAALAEWVRVQVSTPTSRPIDVAVAMWDGEFNERDERNRSIEIAEVALKADWILSIDHDEMIEDRVTRAHLDRLLSHPDPMVRAWDFAWLNHWDSTRLVRVDPPWSDGNKYMTGMRGFRLWRASGRRILAGTENGLHNGNAPDHDVLAKRVASIRFRHYGYLRASDRKIKQARYRKLDPVPLEALTGNSRGYSHLTNEENLMMSPYHPGNGIGLTMLVYSEESVEDLARQFDHLHGVVDRIVLVWTDQNEEAPTEAIAEIAKMHGAEWVRHRFDDHLGEARNAGVDKLRTYGDLGWGLVLDPDEFFPDPWMVTSIRRMAENTDAYGFLFKFANLRPRGSNEPPTHSENVRFFRLDEDGAMRFCGRVHEGFEDSFEALRLNGIQPIVREAPFTMNHVGLSGDDVAIDRKLAKYTKLLILELMDNPGSSGAWMSLGLQYGNERRTEEAYECFQRACACAGEGYLPWKELGVFHLRMARYAYERVVATISPHRSYARAAQEVYRFLKSAGPDQPLLGVARHGPRDSTDFLPPLSEVVARVQDAADRERAAEEAAVPLPMFDGRIGTPVDLALVDVSGALDHENADPGYAPADVGHDSGESEQRGDDDLRAS